MLNNDIRQTFKDAWRGQIRRIHIDTEIQKDKAAVRCMGFIIIIQNSGNLMSLTDI